MGSSPVYFSVGGELTYRLKFDVHFRFQVGVSPYQPEQSRMLSCFVLLRDHVGFKPTFRDYLSVPSSRVKVSSWTAWPLKMGPIGSRETSVLNQITPRNSPEDGSIQFNRGGSLRSRTEQTPLTTKIRKSNPNHCYVSSNDANCQISKSRYRLIKITENQIMTFNAPT